MVTLLIHIVLLLHAAMADHLDCPDPGHYYNRLLDAQQACFDPTYAANMRKNFAISYDRDPLASHVTYYNFVNEGTVQPGPFTLSNPRLYTYMAESQNGSDNLGGKLWCFGGLRVGCLNPGGTVYSSW